MCMYNTISLRTQRKRSDVWSLQQLSSKSITFYPQLGTHPLPIWRRTKFERQAKYSFHLFSGMCNRDGFQPKRKNVSIFMLPSNRGRVFYGFRITKQWKVVKNRCGKLRHSRIGSVVQINKRFSWNQYWKSNREWMRIKNNQKLKSEILLLSRETGSNTGYNRYRTLFSTGYSSVVSYMKTFCGHF